MEAANLVLLLAVLFFVARKPVLTFMGDRRSEIEQNLETIEVRDL